MGTTQLELFSFLCPVTHLLLFIFLEFSYVHHIGQSLVEVRHSMLFHPHRFVMSAVGLMSGEGPMSIDQAALQDFRETALASPDLLCQLLDHECQEGLLAMLKEIRVVLPTANGKLMF